MAQSSGGRARSYCEPARRALCPGGRQQPREGRPTRRPDELLDAGHREFTAPDEPLEEFGHERICSRWAPIRPLARHRTSAAAADGGAVAPRAASARGPRPGPRGAAEQPDGGFAMHARHGDDLVQQLVLLTSRGVFVPLRCTAAYSRRLASRHGALLVGIGNRDF